LELICLQIDWFGVAIVFTVVITLLLSGRAPWADLHTSS